MNDYICNDCKEVFTKIDPEDCDNCGSLNFIAIDEQIDKAQYDHEAREEAIELNSKGHPKYGWGYDDRMFNSAVKEDEDEAYAAQTGVSDGDQRASLDIR